MHDGNALKAVKPRNGAQKLAQTPGSVKFFTDLSLRCHTRTDDINRRSGYSKEFCGKCRQLTAQFIELPGFLVFEPGGKEDHEGILGRVEPEVFLVARVSSVRKL